MTDTDRPTHPNFYLERAQTCTRTIRSWVHRNNPPPLDPEPDSVVWVMGIFDDLERQLVGGIAAAEALAPTAGAERAVTRERATTALNLHRLEVVGNLTKALASWSHSVRWSEGVKPGDLDQLDETVRQLNEHITHLKAQAEEQDLAR